MPSDTVRIWGNHDCRRDLEFSYLCHSTHSLVSLVTPYVPPPPIFPYTYGQAAGYWWSLYCQKDELSCQVNGGEKEEESVPQGRWHPGKHAHVPYAYLIQKGIHSLGCIQVKHLNIKCRSISFLLQKTDKPKTNKQTCTETKSNLCFFLFSIPFFLPSTSISLSISLSLSFWQMSNILYNLLYGPSHPWREMLSLS